MTILLFLGNKFDEFNMKDKIRSVFGEERLFSLIVSQYRSEELIPTWAHKTVMILATVVHFIAISSDLLSFLFRSRISYRISLALFILCSIHLFSLITAQIVLLYRPIPLPFRSPPTQLKLFTSFSSFSLAEAILPLFLLTFFTLQSQTTNWGFYAFAVPILLLAVIQSTVSLLLMSNPIPSTSITSSMDPSFNYIFSLLANTGIILGAQGGHRGGLIEGVSYRVGVCVLYLVVLLYRGSRITYWHEQSTLLTVRLSMFLTVSAVGNLGIFVCGIVKANPYFVYTAYLLSLPMLIRFCSNIVRTAYRVDCFCPGQSSHNIIIGIASLEAIFTKYRRGEINASNAGQFYYYKTLLQNHLLRRQLPTPTLEELVSSGQKLVDFLAEHLEHNYKSENILKLLALLRLTSVFRSLPLWQPTVEKLSQSCRYTLRGRLHLFHLAELFSSRIMTLYQEKKAEPSLNHSLRDLYPTLSQLTSQRVSRDMLDLDLPFIFKRKFEDMVSNFQVAVGGSLQIMEFLQDEKEQGAIDSCKLHKLCRSFIENSVKFESILEGEIVPIKVPPSYFYPPQYVYHALIKHNSSQAKKTLHQYRHTSAIWDILRNKQLSLRIDSMDSSSAVLEVSIEGRNAGEIISITPQSEQLLGIPRDGTLLGHDINELFIGPIRERHTYLMLNSWERLEGIVGVCRLFFVQTFCNELREVSFCVKIANTSQNHVRAVAAIKPFHKDKHLLVVLGPELEVLQAENIFWQTLLPDYYYSPAHRQISHIGQLTKKLPPTIRLLDIADKLDSLVKSGLNYSIEGTLIGELNSCLKSLQVLNDQDKLLFIAESKSRFYKEIRDMSLTIKTKHRSIGGLRLTTLFVSFGSRYLPRENNIFRTSIITSSGARSDKMDIVDSDSQQKEQYSKGFNHMKSTIRKSLILRRGFGSFINFSKQGKEETEDPSNFYTEDPVRIESIFGEINKLIKRIDEELYSLLGADLAKVIDEIRECYQCFEECFTAKAKLRKGGTLGFKKTKELHQGERFRYTESEVKNETQVSSSPDLQAVNLSAKKNLKGTDNFGAVDDVDDTKLLREISARRMSDLSFLKHLSKELIAVVTSPAVTQEKSPVINSTSVYAKAPVQNGDSEYSEEKKTSAGAEVQPETVDDHENYSKRPPSSMSSLLKKNLSMAQATMTLNNSMKFINMLRPVKEETNEESEFSIIECDVDDSVDKKPAAPKRNSKDFVDYSIDPKKKFIRQQSKFAHIRFGVDDLESKLIGVNEEDALQQCINNSSVASLKETSNAREEKKYQLALRTKISVWDYTLPALGLLTICLLYVISSQGYQFVLSNFETKATSLYEVHRLMSNLYMSNSLALMMHVEAYSDAVVGVNVCEDDKLVTNSPIEQLKCQLWRTSLEKSHEELENFSVQMSSSSLSGVENLKKILSSRLPERISVGVDQMKLSPSTLQAIVNHQSLLSHEHPTETAYKPNEESPKILQVLIQSFYLKVLKQFMTDTNETRIMDERKLSDLSDKLLVWLWSCESVIVLVCILFSFYLLVKSQRRVARNYESFSSLTRDEVDFETNALRGVEVFLMLDLAFHESSFIDATTLVRMVNRSKKHNDQLRIEPQNQFVLFNKPASKAPVIAADSLNLAQALLQSKNSNQPSKWQVGQSNKISETVYTPTNLVNFKTKMTKQEKTKPRHQVKSRTIRLLEPSSFFPSITFGLVSNFALLSLIVCSIIVEILQWSRVKSSHHILSFLSTHRDHITQIESSTHQLYLTSPAFTIPTVLTLPTAVDQYNSHLIANMDVLNGMRALSDAVYVNMCTDGVGLCADSNYGTAKKGYLQFEVYHSATVKTWMQDRLQWSQDQWNNRWVSAAWEELRIGGMVNRRKMLSILDNEGKKVYTDEGTTGQKIIVSIMIIASVGLGGYLRYRTKQDIVYSRHIYSIIHPITLFRNLHLLAAFKRTFKLIR
jgi:hypothetical protein